MGIVIGIDVGGSTTKIIGINHEHIKNPMIIKATDPITSLFGAFGKYIYDNEINLSDIEQVMLTGVGSVSVDQKLYGLPTAHTDEFLANGLGAHYDSNFENIIVISMGTGTSIIKVEGDKINHIGGIGIGGGTILGLTRVILKTQDIKHIETLAEKGNIENINLKIKDICDTALPGLPLEAIASIFGKAEIDTKEEDIAAGIIYMVLQSIGQAAVLASLNGNIKDFVLIGNLAKLPQCNQVFPIMEKMYNCRFIIPEYAEYRTALGAALAFIKKRKYTTIK